MIPIAIIVGLFILYKAANRTTVSSGISVGGGTTSIGSNTTDAEVTQGISMALSHDPDPTGISQGILGTAEQISGIFTAAHQAALQKEASTLNNATPTFISQVEQVMTALNEGQITKQQAIGFLQQAQSVYYETVSSIIRGKWAYQGSQFPEPTWSDSYENRSGPYGSSSKNPDSHAPDPCNAACVVGHYFIERTVVGLTKIINVGGGTMTIEASPQNGLIKGTQAVTITYTQPSTKNSFFSLLGL